MGDDALVAERSGLVSSMLAVIDRRDWGDLAGLVTPDVVYHRPGCPPIEGVDAFVAFYRRRCIVASGRHAVERWVEGGGQVFCWGRFEGMSHSGVPLSELFADWFEVRDGRVSRRRTFFYRPAI
ncbi:nuclear transport factor 2 family protein [Dactylosporangium sp. NPDC049525]|uniref:nuclear transport factor 2 family protein n=1 Tax=Dactylosporangium sp. NPDC049525 TaxID=3154730 RepID=UPI00343B1810